MSKYKKQIFQDPSQKYDASLKELLEQQVPTILAHLLEGAIYQETLNIEIVRPTMRVDRVYRIYYRGELHILSAALNEEVARQVLQSSIVLS